MTLSPLIAFHLHISRLGRGGNCSADLCGQLNFWPCERAVNAQRVSYWRCRRRFPHSRSLGSLIIILLTCLLLAILLFHIIYVAARRKRAMAVVKRVYVRVFKISRSHTHNSLACWQRNNTTAALANVDFITSKQHTRAANYIIFML